MKRGEITEASFIIFSVIIIALIFLSFVLYLNNISNNKDFKERYHTRNTGFLIDTIYSSPGNLHYEYDLGDIYKYIINTDENKLIIKSNDLGIGKYQRFTRNSIIAIDQKNNFGEILIIDKKDINIAVSLTNKK